MGSHRLEVVLALVAVIVTAVGVTLVDPAAVGDAGLVQAVGPVLVVGLALGAVAFGLALRHDEPPAWLLVPLLVGAVVALHGLAGLVSPHPRFTTAYLHAGLVEYVLRTGEVLPLVETRFSWPGSFVYGALVAGVGGLDGGLWFLRFAPVVFNVLYLLPVWLVVSTFTANPRARWGALAVFVLANWYGQDYASPQAVNYLLYAVALALALRYHRAVPSEEPVDLAWLPPSLGGRYAHLQPAPHRPGALRFEHPTRPSVAWQAHVASGPLAPGPLAPPRPGVGGVLRRDADPLGPTRRDTRRDVALLLVIVVLAATMAMSHQLTPIVLAIVTTVLVLLRRTRLRLLPLLVVLLTVAWVSFGARAFWSGNLDELLGSVGDVGTSVSTGVSERAAAPSAARTLMLQGRIAMTGALLLFALVGFVRRWRAGYPQLTLLALTFAPFGILALQSYGGEAVIRAGFFALLFASPLVAFAASPCEPTAAEPSAAERAAGARPRRYLAPTRPWVTVAGAAVATIVALALVWTRYGNESFERVTADDLAAVDWVWEHVPPGATVFSAYAGNVPWRDREFNRFEVLSLDPDEVGVPGWLDEVRPAGGAPMAVIVTEAQDRMGAVFEGLPLGWTASLEAELLRTGEFRLVFATPTSRVYATSSIGSDDVGVAASGRRGT